MVDPYARLVAVLRETRRDRGLTQEQLAAVIGVHSTTLKCWELLQFEPKSGLRARWARALGFELGYTLTPIVRERQARDGGG